MGELFAGRYELLDPLGQGGMASVWRAWDAREERVVAAKVLRQTDAVTLLRFVREQAVRVAHPHVLTPLGWAGEDDRVLFTLPVVEGGSVAALVGDHGPLPPVLVTSLVRQLLTALEAVHGAGLLHRDVKPANLLLAATGRSRPHLFLSDFGIAVELDGPRLTEHGAVIGTPGYVAPELDRLADPDPTADLWSVGRCALVMLTGRPGPAAGGLPERPPDVPDALWALVASLVAGRPEDRPRTAAGARSVLPPEPSPWDPARLGDVEVLRHVGDEALGRPQLVATGGGLVLRHAAHPGASATGAGSPADVAPDAGDAADDDPTRERVTVRRVVPAPDRAVEPAAPAHGSRARPVLLAGAVALVAAVALLVLHPWGGADDAAPSRPATPAAGSTSAPAPSPAASSALPTTPVTTTLGTPSAPGTVSVGTVVSRVGQPCDFTEVGMRETTLGGVPVVCRRGTDGRYTWEPPPG